MNTRRRVPYGVVNFEKLVRECYFVDNTAYIRELENNVFEQFWQHYVKARIPAQAYDKMNENFFRTTFASRTWDALPMFYTIEMEYNTPEGRCDFLAVPKPGLAKSACLVEFKCFCKEEAKRLFAADRAEPDAETLAQAKRYRDSLPNRPDWDHAVETAVVEVYGNLGYRWFPVS